MQQPLPAKQQQQQREVLVEAAAGACAMATICEPSFDQSREGFQVVQKPEVFLRGSHLDPRCWPTWKMGSAHNRAAVQQAGGKARRATPWKQGNQGSAAFWQNH